MQDLVNAMNILGKKLVVHDFVKNMFNIDLCSDAYEWISFKLAYTIDTTKLHGFIPVWLWSSV